MHKSTIIIAMMAIILPGSALAQSCKAAKSCAEAVEMWCEGYSAADRDDDGIPCENVCKSKKQVDAIMKKIEACSDQVEGDDKADE
ncbi:excalibur calcium-binding domain-containing protein [Castellaniella sp.]|uniref:excalibur calcium-binding domain-containing protein n=1 Tax=Castellaniella sp. TaxID=1955812 RepID=UPI002AFDCA7C|nr:excalibur calcium-binding domain-containing protein [Castellaniella sp.]